MHIPMIFLNKTGKIMRKASKDISRFNGVEKIKSFKNKAGVNTVIGYDKDNKAKYAFTQKLDGTQISKQYATAYLLSIGNRILKTVNTIIEKDQKITENSVTRKFSNNVLKEIKERKVLHNGVKKEKVISGDKSSIEVCKRYPGGDVCKLTKNGDKIEFTKRYSEGISVCKIKPAARENLLAL